MSAHKTTCLIHIYNEEYLLPFWLYHHKDIFDDILIIDYRSNDKSIDFCKKICPNCKIITTRNEFFGAEDVDREIMDLETNIEGIKIVLNVTEFLFCEKPIKDIFNDLATTSSLSIRCISPYSKQFCNINNNYELFTNLLKDNITYHYDRGERVIHNYSRGNYSTGRHSTTNPTTHTHEMHIIWLGFYPLNERILQRKQQIQINITQRDRIIKTLFNIGYTKAEITDLLKNKGYSVENLV